jgi:oxygen-dependent protoporphyrinogen oxidase
MLDPAPSAADRFLWRRGESGGTLIPFPRSPLGFIRSPILSAKGKLRLVKEFRVPPQATDDETAAQFIRTRFGDEACGIAAAGLSGIYAADIETLSARSALPKLWSMAEKGSILRALISRRREKEKRPSIVSFRGGMETLAAALAGQFGPEELRFNSPVRQLRPRHDSVEVAFGSGILRSICVPRAVLAVPADETSRLLAPIEPELAVDLGKIPYAPIGLIEMSYEAAGLPRPLNGFGFLATPKPGYPLLGAIYCSALFPDRVPAGHHLISCFAGGAANPDLSNGRDEAVQSSVLAELSAVLGANIPGRVIAAEYWPRAIPNFALHHHRLIARLEQFERRRPLLRCTGNWRSGVSIGDCIAAANRFAREALHPG